MTAAELFHEFENAQQTEGEFAYFSLLLFMRGIGGAQHINSGFPGHMILGLLSDSVERNDIPLGIIGIPTLNALHAGQVPYVKRFIEDDWATGYIDGAIKTARWLIENNPNLHGGRMVSPL